MGGFNRAIARGANGMRQEMKTGDGWPVGPDLVEDATNANTTITIEEMAAGVLNLTSFSAGHNLTTPTAAAIVAAFPQMDVGDTLHMIVAMETAYAATLAAGTGVTLSGKATVAASSHAHLLFKVTYNTS